MGRLNTDSIVEGRSVFSLHDIFKSNEPLFDKMLDELKLIFDDGDKDEWTGLRKTVDDVVVCKSHGRLEMFVRMALVNDDDDVEQYNYSHCTMNVFSTKSEDWIVDAFDTEEITACEYNMVDTIRYYDEERVSFTKYE